MATDGARDAAARHEAIDPGRSFIVQAPAGSGKTSLLTLRYLRLLATVDSPEEIVAITFTRKAAAEMRHRIVRALSLARGPLAADALPHVAELHATAAAALARSLARGWDLERNPARLHVQTIDGLSHWLAQRLPLAAQVALSAALVDDARPLYREAARRLVSALEADDERSEPLDRLARTLDHDPGQLAGLVADMLGTREVWLPKLFGEPDRSRLRAVIDELLCTALETELARLRARLARLRLPVVVRGRARGGRGRRRGGPAGVVSRPARLAAGERGRRPGLARLCRPPAHGEQGRRRAQEGGVSAGVPARDGRDRMARAQAAHEGRAGRARRGRGLCGDARPRAPPAARAPDRRAVVPRRGAARGAAACRGRAGRALRGAREPRPRRGGCRSPRCTARRVGADRACARPRLPHPPPACGRVPGHLAGAGAAARTAAGGLATRRRPDAVLRRRPDAVHLCVPRGGRDALPAGGRGRRRRRAARGAAARPQLPLEPRHRRLGQRDLRVAPACRGRLRARRGALLVRGPGARGRPRRRRVGARAARCRRARHG